MLGLKVADLGVQPLRPIAAGTASGRRDVLQSTDLDIGLPGTAVFSSDRVADTIDYEQVALRIRELAASGHFRLVETVAERVAALLKEMGAPWCKVSVSKLGILANARLVGVTIERGRR